ncbi:hypothetical protein CTA2_5729 [Colletotrichum tanaceti]|uniref:Uncharacterized protein n=1 Tax=Colletotrichum tanaceti TaxID=1306861 RepID=A0A4U6XGP9_9PEZI|nr:hypothetical protein CTA2_5720 [Colletotrichum tanaceti]KAJ0168984.1 hypothetical protein CTA2_5729 [Colletotrichum tanaceti]TKW54569.1 hypothetical protein CTA1_2262 [Colletotrichum tanaceti]
MLAGTLLSVLSLMGGALGAPVEHVGNILARQSRVGHDDLSPSPERVQNNAVGAAIARFNPRLHINHGCQPYTAVNDAGDISGGLKPTGTSEGGCRDKSRGQVYARGTWHNGKFAIMYAFYFPKDQPNDGVPIGSHRHDWECVVVWLNNPAVENPEILGGAPSAHGNFAPTTTPQRDGDKLLVEYFTQDVRNHELRFSSTAGQTYPVLDWDAMTPEMRTALTNADFGSANVPFKDENFVNNLNEAFV